MAKPNTENTTHWCPRCNKTTRWIMFKNGSRVGVFVCFKCGKSEQPLETVRPAPIIKKRKNV